MLFDTHAHYDDERFEKEVPGGAEALLEQLFSSDVGKIINAGTTVESSKTCLHLAEKFKGMYAAVGIHPSDCYKYSDIDSTLEEIKKLSKHPKAVAIGEIGLDYHYDFSPKDVQKVWFSAQLELAKELSLPVIIHDREAHGAVMDMIAAHPNVRGVLHSYSGSAEMARQLCDRGWMISLSGVVTFKNARQTVEVAETVPLDHLLVETDCPYLTPVPHRGKTNHSGYLVHTVERIAEIRGISEEEVRDITRKNALRFFGI